MESPPFQNENTLGKFSLHPEKAGCVVISCEFKTEVSVECIVQDAKGRIRKKLNFKADANTKTIELDLDGLDSNLFQVWFYVDESTYFREIRFLKEEKASDESKIGRFFRLFT